jgi:ParB family chromosome partitioning protein
MDVREIPLSALAPSRNLRLQLGDLRELGESIREHGVLQPIRARPTGDGRFQIIAGHRRAAAARLVGLQSIPAVIVQESDTGVAIQNVVENLQRENLSPLEIVRGVRELHDSFGLTLPEVARALSKSVQRVRTYFRAGLLPDEVLEKLQSGEGGTQEVKGLTLRHVEPFLAAISVDAEGRVSSDGALTAVRSATALVQEVERRGVRINAHMADAVARGTREGRISIEEAVGRVLADPEQYRYGRTGLVSSIEIETDTWEAYREIQRNLAVLVAKLKPEIGAMFAESQQADLRAGAEITLARLEAYVAGLTQPSGAQRANDIPGITRGEG